MPSKRKAEVEEAESASSADEAASSADEEPAGVIGDYSGVTRKTTHKKKKVLVMCSRGVTTTSRELVEDLLKLLPHGRKEPNFNKREPLTNVAEIAQLAGCRLCLYFEARKMKDLYMWAADVDGGPSAKFMVEQVRRHTQNPPPVHADGQPRSPAPPRRLSWQVKAMGDTRLSGNCLLGSRPMLSFDASFDEKPHLQLVRQLFSTIFSIPKGHPGSKPFHDHVMSFTYVQEKVVVRHYQVLPPLHDKKREEESLVEIGPRLTLVPIRIFGSPFGGDTLYANGKFVTPNESRAAVKRQKGKSAKGGVAQKEKRRARIMKGADQQPADVLDDVFDE